MITKKNFFIFLVPFLTFCSCLYHLVYWGRFGLNGLQLISIQDILKSTAKPLAVIFGVFLLNLCILKGLRYLRASLKKITQSEDYGKWFIRMPLLVTVAFIVIVIIFSPQLKWILIVLFVGLLIMQFGNLNRLFAPDFRSIVNKFHVTVLIILLPLLSIGFAFQNSELIINNVYYKYMLREKNVDSSKKIDVDTLKFIGITDKNFVFTDIKNEIIYFLPQDTMTLRHTARKTRYSYWYMTP